VGRIALVSDPVIEPFAFTANCLATDVVGNCVYISADLVLGIIQVTKTDITTPLKVPARGLILSKSSPTVCRVAYYGAMDLSGIIPPLSPGRRYFVGADSNPNVVPPLAPAIRQVVGVALDSSRLMIDPSFYLVRLT